MKPQPSIPEEVQQWLRLAFDDLRLADLAVDAEPPMTGLALYHAQQAAEKSLKGFLVSRGSGYPLSHNLATILKPALAFDPTLEQVVLPALNLTGFATLYRYPGEPEEPTTEEARRWVSAARSVYEAVLGRLECQEPSGA